MSDTSAKLTEKLTARLEQVKDSLLSAFDGILEPDFNPQAPGIIELQREGNQLSEALGLKVG